MPQMANIAVTKNDGTTAVTYTQVVPSAGDRSPALWRNLTVGTASAHRPTLTCSAQPNGPKTARRVNVSFVWPTIAASATGQVTVVDKSIFEGSWLLPVSVPDADINEFASQLSKLLASTLLVDTVKSAFAPT